MASYPAEGRKIMLNVRGKLLSDRAKLVGMDVNPQDCFFLYFRKWR
jgi:hypothetical protein